MGTGVDHWRREQLQQRDTTMLIYTFLYKVGTSRCGYYMQRHVYCKQVSVIDGTIVTVKTTADGGAGVIWCVSRVEI